MGLPELAQLWMQDCPDLLLLFGSMAALRRGRQSALVDQSKFH